MLTHRKHYEAQRRHRQGLFSADESTALGLPQGHGRLCWRQASMSGDDETLPGDSRIGERSEAGAEPATILSKGALVGHYLVLECLGVGGMGVVHAAYDPEL